MNIYKKNAIFDSSRYNKLENILERREEILNK